MKKKTEIKPENNTEKDIQKPFFARFLTTVPSTKTGVQAGGKAADEGASWRKKDISEI